MTRLWPLALGGAAVASLVTWLPMLAHRFPALGLPPYAIAPGIDAWQMQAFFLLAGATVGVLVAQSDRWLGGAVALAGLTLFYRGALLDPTHTVVFAFGALILVGVRAMPARYHEGTKRALLILGGVHCAYTIQQHAGYDVLWGPALGGTLNAHIQPLGLLGSVNATAGYLAILAPLAPAWLAIIFAAVVVMSHSLGAVLALIAGLAWRMWLSESRVITAHGARRSAYLVVGGILAVGAIVSAAAMALWLQKATQAARVVMWNFGLADWWKTDPIIGYGLGGWGARIPALQAQTGFSPTGELWREAHNEPVQWLAEMGLIGAALLGLWLWSHRHMFVAPVWGPSVIALTVTTLTWHTFHIVASALLGLIVIGLATPRQEESTCAVA